MRKFFVLCLVGYCLLGKAQAEDYVTAHRFRQCAQFTYEDRKQEFPFEKVKNGDAVYVKGDLAERFLKKYHDRIPSRYILITHYNDRSCPGRCASYLDDEKLLAWFGQNVEGMTHPKLIPIPIGLQIETMEKGGGAILDEERKRGEDIAKTQLVYMNFSRSNMLKERGKVVKLLVDEPYCVVAGRKDFRSYLRDLAQTKFILSPRGLGLDCYRTWEALYMGSVPIVKRSAMDSIFEGLPVLIVDEWSEINEAFLNQKWEEMSQNNYCDDKLFMDYWIRLIDSYRGR
jgi:hypothetical protein